jgi:hypothetical protein
MRVFAVERSDLVGARQRVDHRAWSGQSGLLSKAGLILAPLPDWNYEKQIGAIGKVCDVGHPVRPIMTQYSQLLLIPMRTYDHDVRTHVKLASR